MIGARLAHRITVEHGLACAKRKVEERQRSLAGLERCGIGLNAHRTVDHICRGLDCETLGAGRQEQAVSGTGALHDVARDALNERPEPRLLCKTRRNRIADCSGCERLSCFSGFDGEVLREAFDLGRGTPNSIGLERRLDVRL